MVDCSKSPPPSTLKACLQLMGSLSQAGNKDVVTQVMSKLKDQVRNYCKPSYVAADSNLDNVFSHVNRVLATIYPGGTIQYGQYNTLTTECVQHIVTSLESCLPKAFSVLYFLFFNTYGRLHITGSGKWSSLKVDATREQESNKTLQKWLMSQESGKVDQNLTTPGLIPGGFVPGDLKESTSTGQTLVTKLNQIVSHNAPASLQKSLVMLLFLGPWHDAKLGHALVFLRALCEEIEDDGKNTFKEKFTALKLPGTYDKFKVQCANLKKSLHPFVDGSTTKIQAVCQLNTALYSEVWEKGTMDTTKFNNYVQWLRCNLEGLKSSLKSMLDDCKQWTVSNLSSAISAGPFRYGFVLMDSTWSSYDFKSKMRSPVNALAASLVCLLIAVLSPLTLRTSLQLFAKLNNLTMLKQEVKDNIKGMLDQYCKSSSKYMTLFAHRTNTSGVLHQTLNLSNQLLGDILQSTDGGKHGHYNDLKDTTHQDCNCVKGISKYLQRYLPQVYAALYYLYYNTSDDFKDIKGADWAQHSLSDGNKELVKWLKDQIGSKSSLIERGFGLSNLSGYSGYTVAGNLKILMQYEKAKPLQETLTGMLFISEFSDDHTKYSMTGHLCVFLHKFCSQVESGTLKDMYDNAYSEGLKSECSKVKNELAKFIGTQAKSDLRAVCKDNEKLYDDLWNDNFKVYLDWLKNNMENLKASLEQIQHDFNTWKPETLKQAETAGPFRYGLVPVQGTWAGTMQSQLQGPIAALITSIDSLKRIFGELKPKEDTKEVTSVGHTEKGFDAIGSSGSEPQSYGQSPSIKSHVYSGSGSGEGPKPESTTSEVDVKEYVETRNGGGGGLDQQDGRAGSSISSNVVAISGISAGVGFTVVGIIGYVIKTLIF